MKGLGNMAVRILSADSQDWLLMPSLHRRPRAVLGAPNSQEDQAVTQVRKGPWLHTPVGGRTSVSGCE